MSTKSPQRLKLICFRFFLICLSLLLGVTVSEIIVRIFDLAPQVGFIHESRYRLSANPKIGYEPNPQFEFKDGEKKFYDAWLGADFYEGKINSLGYRDYEHTVSKKEGVYRIMVIGDSIAAGWAIAKYEETYPALLEKRLNAIGKPSEVINLGVAGYNTQQEVETLKDKGLAFKPDLVLLSYCLNDRESASGVLFRLLHKEKTGEKISLVREPRILAYSALYHYLRYKVFKKDIDEGKRDSKETQEYIDKYREIVSRDTVEEYFGHLASLAYQYNFRVMVVVFPFFDKFMDSETYPYMEEHLKVKFYCRQHNFLHLDLLEDFQNRQKRSPKLYFDKTHPNHEGYRYVAEVIANFIHKNIK